MKNILLIAFVLAAFFATSQVPPQGINYQAVARNNNGQILVNSTMDVRLSIISDIVNNVIQYQETHNNVQTNQFGLFTLVIGQGTQSGGIQPNFASIPWGSTTPFLKIEVNTGSGFIDMGTMQFWSVPYALYAANGGGGGTGPTGPTGANGVAGVNGSAGPAGPTGAAGANGATGPIGAQGVGVPGSQGPIGATGPTGPAGLSGTSGPQGPQGFNGNTGPTGPTGVAGSQGAQGPAGPAGIQGPTGGNGPAGPTGPTGSTDMAMFTPVNIASGSNSTGWLTFDASTYIPAGAKFVIIEAEVAQLGPDNGDIDAHIRIRPTGSSVSYLLLRGRAAANGDNTAWGGQGIFPVNNSRQFDYIVESPGFDGGYALRLVGYIY